MKLSPLTAADFGKLKVSDPNYYNGRWPYMSKAIEFALEIRPQSVLELGPYKRPLFQGCDVMDLCDNLVGQSVRWKMDARKCPWPISDQVYDLFVALQVWEHLGPNQEEAFSEVRRVAKAALLSFPLDWKTKDPNDCHNNITMDTINRWTLGIKPSKLIVISTPSPAHKRAICLFKF